MTRFRQPDIWDDDDPAVTRADEELRRVADALARMDAPEAAQDAPGRPEPTPVASTSGTEPVLEPEAPRRNVVGELVQRIRDGDLSAVDVLRKLVDRG